MKLKTIIMIIVLCATRFSKGMQTSSLEILSPEQLVPLVLEKAQKILSKNKNFNNRDLIREFFIQNPQFITPAKIDENNENINDLKSTNVAIIGAGPSGLIAAFALAKNGHTVNVYEKRSEKEFALRWHNVSINVPHLIQEEFPELNELLKEQKLIHYEMELEDPTKLRSYRIAIGDFQNALTQICKNYKVAFHFGGDFKPENVDANKIIILATGAHTFDQLKNKFRKRFDFKSFPEYTTHGVAALLYEPETELTPGLTKEIIFNSDIHWGFKLTFVGSGIASQAVRLAVLNPNHSKFTSIHQNSALYWYLFATRTERPSQLPFSEPVDIYSFVDFIPSLATKGALLHKGNPLILWGDARTSGHPLTGAALTIPFRSIKPLLDLVQNFDTDSSSLERYNEQTYPLAQELFIKTLLATLF